MRLLIFSLLAAVSLASISDAQSPRPVVVPAMTPATSAKSPATPDAAGSTQATLKALQAVKAANDEILRQQAALLLKLDEIEKAANEIRIYSKRS
jgi:hypothetical protein